VFSKLSRKTLGRAALFKDVPVYVQFYVTARCNLTCEQCNVIFANADVRECGISEIERIADNLAELGVAIVLLTGGEPFARKDLPEIIRAFESRGVHVRMQTNGLATEAQIVRAIEAGGCDISISLDTLDSAKQDRINGGFPGSWNRALKAIATFSSYLPKEGSFASLGCVMQPTNVGDIEDVVRFGSAIGWYSSVVPVHIGKTTDPRGFRTFNSDLGFRSNEIAWIDTTVERLRWLREAGFLLYDSDQYLDDICRFVRGEPITWRDRHGGVCDSPNLYFAILPNGEFAPCCDHRMIASTPVFAPDFARKYSAREWRSTVREVVSACDGCMYGSYPEMTISMRFLSAKIQRFRTFLSAPVEKDWPLEYEYLLELATEIRLQERPRPCRNEG
jgi:MoaA/NifB/PqqE/SkfB family radical SAM enzyme